MAGSCTLNVSYSICRAVTELSRETIRPAGWTLSLRDDGKDSGTNRLLTAETEQEQKEAAKSTCGNLGCRLKSNLLDL